MYEKSMEDNNRAGIIKALAEGLKQKPAYLLIFAIWVSFLMFGFGTGAYGIIYDKPIPLYLSFSSFVVALIVAAYVVKIVEVQGLTQVEKIEDFGFQKLAYIKILYLSKMEGGKNPIYHRTIERLGNEEVSVFDEFVFYSLNIYSQEHEQYSCEFRSSGIIDLRIVHPWKEKLAFPDKDAQFQKGYMKQTINESSNVYYIVCHHYNGLQPGHEDIGMRMDEDTKYARLVVDFSSIPNSELIFKERPKAILRTENEEKSIGIIEKKPSIYSTSQGDLKKGQFLRIDFKIDWEKLQY